MLFQTQQGTWNLKKEIASGLYSRIYQTCDNKEICSYICKVISNTPDKDVEQEIAIQNKLKRFAPTIRDHFKVGVNHYIVMDSLDITVKDFLKMFRDDDLKNIFFTDCKEVAIQLINYINSKCINHGDVHMANFMFNFSYKGKKFINRYLEKDGKFSHKGEDKLKAKYKETDDFFGIKSMKVIDFGRSTICDDKEKMKKYFKL